MLESGKGGSVAGAAFSPCGTLESYQPLIREIMANLFWRGERVLGKAVFAAKCSVIARYPTLDNYYGPAVLYTLFGDPALRVKLRQQTGLSSPPRFLPPGGVLEVHPNPTRGPVSVRYSLATDGHVRLRILTATGAVAGVLEDGLRSAGEYCCAVDTRNLAAGVYIVQLAVAQRGCAESVSSRKLVVR